MGMSDWKYARPDMRNAEDARRASAFSNRVYGWMSIGLGFTAVIAYLVYSTGLYFFLMPFWWVAAFGTLGIALTINFAIQRLSMMGLAALFLGYAGLEGVLFGTILPGFASAYGGGTIWAAFLTGAAVFGLAMGYGIFTKNDLTSLGRILTFGLIGLMGVTLLYAVLSLFVNLTFFSLLISYLGLVLFVGLTAFDAQTIRRMSVQVDAHSTASYKLSLIMALRMYINVIMIFWYLLQIFSSNRR